METRTAEFTAKYVNQPDGKRPGSIKTEADELIKAWPEEITKFSQGQRYRAVLYNKPYEGKDQWIVSGTNKGGSVTLLGESNVVPGPGTTPVAQGTSAPPQTAFVAKPDKVQTEIMTQSSRTFGATLIEPLVKAGKWNEETVRKYSMEASLWSYYGLQDALDIINGKPTKEQLEDLDNQALSDSNTAGLDDDIPF
jgi:hypothetical protein